MEVRWSQDQEETNHITKILGLLTKDTTEDPGIIEVTFEKSRGPEIFKYDDTFYEPDIERRRSRGAVIVSNKSGNAVTLDFLDIKYVEKVSDPEKLKSFQNHK